MATEVEERSVVVEPGSLSYAEGMAWLVLDDPGLIPSAVEGSLLRYLQAEEVGSLERRSG